MQKFTLKELAEFDGKQGRKAYIAYKGKVYDITESKLWKDGKHMNRHSAGTDLTYDIVDAPHKEEVLSKFTLVGELVVEKLADVKEQDTKGNNADKTEFLRKIYEKLHPHPVLVHYPMAFLPFTFLMQILYVYTGIEHFFYAGYYSLVCGFLGMLAAGSAGAFSWWVNYQFSLSIRFKLKISLTILLIIILPYELYCGFQYIKQELATSMIFYNVLLFINLLPLFTIAYNGGKLTWK